MRRVGQSRRRDANEASIVKTLRQVGALVILISEKGAPDLLVWHARCGVKLVEIKTKKGDLTPAQVTMHRLMPIEVIRSVDDALALVSNP